MTRPELLKKACEIAEAYKKAGYSLTLRQLYYQCVAGGHIPNSDKSYKQLGDVLGDARLAGEFAMDLIIDRGRHAGGSKQTECLVDVNDALEEAGKYVSSIPHWTIKIDRWFGQETYVSCWVEKEALSGVFEKPCADLGVGFFACKGYPSHSALWEWLQKLQKAYQVSQETIEDDEGREEPVKLIQEAVVLYFGDHDPDGWQIPRSAEEGLNVFARVHNLDVPPIRFERVALNMEQITKFKPPPFPAKETSSRYASYFKEHGIKEAWELDALKPDVLDKLIRANVVRYWDKGIYAQWQGFANENRARLQERMLQPDWLAEVFE